jgi:hypothetical protein
MCTLISSQVTVVSGGWKLTIAYQALRSTLNPGGLSIGLYVFEQLSQYSVQLYQQQNGHWQQVLQESGPGFSEWSLSMYL